MDALIPAARQRQRPRDLAIFLILRYSGMRRASVASLRVRNLDPRWGLRNVPVKGGKTRDIPLPTIVMQFLDDYVTQHLPTLVESATPDTPLFWSTYGQRRQGTVRRPMESKNIWRLCKTYGRIIGYPMLKPHDLRHGVAMEVYEQHHDLEQVRGLLGHTRIETTQLYAQIRPRRLSRPWRSTRSRRRDARTTSERDSNTISVANERTRDDRKTADGIPCLRNLRMSSNTERKTSAKTTWWPQRDSNPCFSLERAVS